jgi:hypothetical protein
MTESSATLYDIVIQFGEKYLDCKCTYDEILVTYLEWKRLQESFQFLYLLLEIPKSLSICLTVQIKKYAILYLK